jgi:hypothetical protein
MILLAYDAKFDSWLTIKKIKANSTPLLCVMFVLLVKMMPAPHVTGQMEDFYWILK